MANKAKYYNTKNKHKMLRQNKARKAQSVTIRRASEEAKRAS